MAGTKAGHVAILTESTVEKSIKLFDNSVQWKNATLVHYVDNTIYAVAQDSKLTKLNLNLENRQVLGCTVSQEVFALTATNRFVALGGVSAKVTVYDTEGNITLVRTTFTVKFNVQDITKLVDCSCCTIFSTFFAISFYFKVYHHDNRVYSISIDGDRIASGSMDKTCQVWSIPQKKKLYTVVHNGSVINVRFLPRGDQLVTSSSDKTVRIWKNGYLAKVLSHSSCCYGIAVGMILQPDVIYVLLF